MLSQRIIENVCNNVKEVMMQAEGLIEGGLNLESASQVSEVLNDLASTVWVTAMKTWIEDHEIAEDQTVLEVEGEKYRFKYSSEKTFLTPGGEMTISRRIFQPDNGGKCYVPLDAAWGMEGERSTVEVREAVLYSAALLTPKESATLFAKCSLFQPKETNIKKLAQQMGNWLEKHEAEVLANIHAEETIPSETEIVCASLDGVNVLLSEPGKKKGRPQERPGNQQEKESQTCYKNAMVGSVSLYQQGVSVDPAQSEPVQEMSRPVRLQSRYVARMPEDRFPTLKQKFETELKQLESQLDDDVVRILLNDGARCLWSYLDENPQFDHYEKLIDFHHACEHLSLAAEALFGKRSKASEQWYDKSRRQLQEHADGAARVIRSIDYYLKRLSLSQSRQTDVLREQRYFKNNKQRMEYARFLKNGWPIGSGPVEAACKSVVKTRLCRSGMRWSRTGGQHILSLRTMVKSDRWDFMWNEYKKQKQANYAELST